MPGINTILICHSTALHRIKYKWPVSVQTMTVWCFSMLWNRVFETSVHPWKYNFPLIFLCSSFLLLFFHIFLLFCPFSFVKPAQCRLPLPPALCLPRSPFPFLSAVPILYFWTVDQNSESQYDFLFQPVWWKWRGINLTTIGVTKGYRSYSQAEERKDADLRGQSNLTV